MAKTYKPQTKTSTGMEDMLLDAGSLNGKKETYFAKASDITVINQKIAEIELAKFPNVTIIGQPTIQQGQISNFTVDNYVRFPFIVNFQNRPFTIDFAMTTGNDIASQQNLLDSTFGLAFAVRNSKFVLVVSSTGTNWDFGELVGSHTLLVNTSYRVRISWDGNMYSYAYSTDGGQTYTVDATKSFTLSPYPKQIYIGRGADGTHVFKGIIDLNYATLTISDKVVWQGMDDVGLATRMAVDMSNIDEAGVEKIKDIVKDKADKIVIEVGSAQAVFFTKVFPKIPIDIAKTIYDTYIAGNVVIIRWKVMNAIPVEATVLGSDYVNGYKSFNFIMHDTYAVEYSYTDSTTDYAETSVVDLKAIKDVSKSDINGNIKIDGDEVKVYTLPNMKTINGNDILGDGDITIPKGDKGDPGTTSWNDITDKPTNVSAFNNDAGYLTSHQDISGKVNKTGDIMSGALFFTGGGNQPGTSVSKQDDMLALGTETSKIWLFQAGARAGTLDFSAWVGGQDPIYYFPAKGGTFAMTSDIPTSLPANGGTSDWSKKVWTTSNPNEWWVDFTYNDGYFMSQGMTYDGSTIPLKVSQADNATKVANFGIGDIFNKAQSIAADGSQFASRQMNGELPDGLSDVYNWGAYLSFAQPSARFEIYAPHQGTDYAGIWVRTGWNNERKDWKRLVFSAEMDSYFSSYLKGYDDIGTVYKGYGQIGDGNSNFYASVSVVIVKPGLARVDFTGHYTVLTTVSAQGLSLTRIASVTGFNKGTFSAQSTSNIQGNWFIVNSKMSDAMGYGTCFENSSGYYKFARYYTAGGAVGGWSSSDLSNTTTTYITGHFYVPYS